MLDLINRSLLHLVCMYLKSHELNLKYLFENQYENIFSNLLIVDSIMKRVITAEEGREI